jgi:hypothetical protein
VKIVYSLSKKILTFNNKQFCNKVASFMHEGAIYCYVSDNGLYREENEEELHEKAD